jgi:hypothetical protein
MEIAPISGIRFMPVMPTYAVDGEISPVFDIETLAGIGRDPFSAKHEESRGGMQNEADDIGEDDDEFDGQLFTPTGKRQIGRRLSYFA